jgi:aryl-alcohol dehydrogenase-like predicted oxidoreductase
MGEILKSLPAKRSELVVSVKMFGGTGLNTINDQGLSRKKVIESMRNSLKRL